MNQTEDTRQADSELFDAVVTIAKAGSLHVHSQWINEWNGRRYHCGHRFGNPEQTYAEVTKLVQGHLASPEAAAKATECKLDINAVTGTILLFKVRDDSEVVAHRPGKWIADTLAEAERLRKLPKDGLPFHRTRKPDKDNFEPHDG